MAFLIGGQAVVPETVEKVFLLGLRHGRDLRSGVEHPSRCVGRYDDRLRGCSRIWRDGYPLQRSSWGKAGSAEVVGGDMSEKIGHGGEHLVTVLPVTSVVSHGRLGNGLIVGRPAESMIVRRELHP